ncbi:YjjG family noncanonical pyrimidine nucleotidase [Marivirga arenosa]|uniref:YjjG family noncanonical pyrimidine nucleotidase n=1 Tax=Marivirga arenosa TaxID=3059076 RepID=A0AA49GCZ4_9BACT|nr:YjjG family noncanonical pyrimidine nucleotidase [Marivirga sp. BKB1-2]WKK79073.2 YjjG family noncanonical pyrimidine nucleotidase [Marivirga sp. BKB1-2]
MGKINQYKHIFFDLDHTLWDYEKNSEEVLNELFLKYQLEKLGVISCNHFQECFEHINKDLWNEFNKNKINRDTIREQRFLRILNQFQIDDAELSSKLSDEYLMLCPTKPHLMPFTIEVLQYLKENYQLHILTNGFNDVQKIKLEKSNLHPYFATVVTSDSAGYKKPMTSIFKYAVEKADARIEESIMIGDNLQTDILGARNFGMDTVYYNPGKEKHKSRVTHEIDCLSQLKTIF